MKGWCVNIGDNVKKGQLLAELTDPELDADHKERLALIDQAIAKARAGPGRGQGGRGGCGRARAKLARFTPG